MGNRTCNVNIAGYDIPLPHEIPPVYQSSPIYFTKCTAICTQEFFLVAVMKNVAKKGGSSRGNYFYVCWFLFWEHRTFSQRAIFWKCVVPGGLSPLLSSRLISWLMNCADPSSAVGVGQFTAQLEDTINLPCPISWARVKHWKRDQGTLGGGYVELCRHFSGDDYLFKC